MIANRVAQRLQGGYSGISWAKIFQMLVGIFRTWGNKMVHHFVFKYSLPNFLTAKFSLNCLKYGLIAIKLTKLTKMEKKMFAAQI